MPIYASGIDFLKLMEGLLNKLIEKEVITIDEANKLIEEAKTKNDKE